MSDGVYCCYYRVSTEKQGRSGLGLEAQKIAVHAFVNGSKGLLAGEFTEIETGRRKDRPQLLLALDLCAKRRATLVIAKLDRLARNVAFVSALLESRVRFIAADMPEADVTFLQMAAVFGEWEARRISERTKSALAAAKARGRLLGWSNPARRSFQFEASRRGANANKEIALQFAANVLPIVESIRGAGIVTLADIACSLNARGVPTQRGGKWHPVTVSRLLARRREPLTQARTA